LTGRHRRHRLLHLLRQCRLSRVAADCTRQPVMCTASELYDRLPTATDDDEAASEHPDAGGGVWHRVMVAADFGAPRTTTATATDFAPVTVVAALRRVRCVICTYSMLLDGIRCRTCRLP